MSWDEWLFKKTYRIYKKKKPSGVSLKRASLLDMQRSLEVGFEAIAGQPASVQEAQEFVGFYKGHLFLPEQISILESKELNERLYWLLICFHATAVFEFAGLKWSVESLLERVILEFRGLNEVVLYLRKFATNKENRFDLVQFFGNPPVLGGNTDSNMGPFEKQNESNLQARSSVLQKKGPNVAELKEFEESKENPLVHMFEKVQTIEAYEGGNKSKQAEDSLESIEEALEEVQLRTVIRSTEHTPGLIKTNSIVESAGIMDEPTSFAQKKHQIFYPEWDQSKREYRKNWCAVNVSHSVVTPSSKVRTPSGQKLKARLESLFNHFMWQGQQLDGPDLDLQPLIENQVSRIMGGTLTDRIFIKRINQVRDFEVLIMMDESLSTESYIGRESILGMMKDSVSDLAQAFESASEQLAVMSFFSETRLNCSVKLLKDFSESIETFHARLATCRPQGYTRIGVAIRHAIEFMKKSRARRRCIVLLTDAKPTDVDRYEGRYGMADVKKAVEELRTEGLELIVLSYAEGERERFVRMFPKQVSIFHTTNRKSMSTSLLEVVERLALRR